MCEGEALSSVIKELGTVVDNGISAAQCTITRQMETNHLINQAYSFKVILLDKKGNKVSRETLDRTAVNGLVIEVAGSSNVMVCSLSFFHLQGVVY